MVSPHHPLHLVNEIAEDLHTAHTVEILRPGILVFQGVGKLLRKGIDGGIGILFIGGDAGQEIGPDEHAVSSAGLTDISDLELEKIMQEALSDEWLEDAVQQEAVQEPILDVIQDQEYSDSAVDPIDEMQAVVKAFLGMN